MRPILLRILFATALLAAAFSAGCAKKPPAQTAVPPQAPAPAPTNTNPNPPAPTPTPTTTGNPAPSRSDLKPVLFALDSYTLDDAAKAVLDANAKLLRDNASWSVRLEGNCDERGTVEYNQALGQRRAEAVREYLAGAGVDGARLTTFSYGKENPVTDGHDESAWAQNRRVDFGRQ